MKIGFQTIIWGPHIPCIDYLKRVLDIIAAAGYQGVEFAQRTDALGVRHINELLQLLSERGLTLLGFAGGTLKQRVEFCGEFRPAYLYIENWDPQVAPADVLGDFTLALHLHVFKPRHRLADALALLKERPELKFIPDTAHLTIAGDDPISAIRQTRDRIAAVHLKDWTPVFGRSSHRYARGFVELGKGRVPLKAVLQELQSISYSGWLVVELDSPSTDPVSSTVECAEWLAAQGLLPSRPRRIDAVVPPNMAFTPQEKRCHPEAEATFVRTIMTAATEGVDSCYETIAQAFYDLVPCSLVTVWTCSPAEDLMSLLATKPSVPITNYVLTCGSVLSGRTVAEQAVMDFDLTKPENAEVFGDQELMERLQLKRMISVPILNTRNPNHVRYLVNLFPDHEHLPVSQEELFCFGHDVALGMEAALEELCSTAAARANFLAGKSRDAQEYLKFLLMLIRDLLDCEGVAIFLVDDLGTRLELKATTGTVWHSEEQFYKKGEGTTGRVWERNEPFLSAEAKTAPGWRGKSSEVVESPRYDNCLIAPLVNHRGEVIGVVRCRNKRPVRNHNGFRMFSDDDAAVLEAIGQAAVHHLEFLLARERRAEAHSRITHVLKVPLVGIRAAVERIQRLQGDQSLFEFDYPGDIMSWSELMGRLLKEADLPGHPLEGRRFLPRRTILIRDVIAPAVRQVQSLLNERGFSSRRIDYDGSRQIPPLGIDRNQFQQVMFNLLSNAIKYCYKDPASFRVEIGGEARRREVVIWFRDWGPGIPAGMEEKIFEEEVRGPNASNSEGQGLGLWLVRQIVEWHGGRIKVTSSRLPTEFTIYLPRSRNRSGRDRQ